MFADVAADGVFEGRTDLKTPRRMRLRVTAEKKLSTALSQEAVVGVK